jgi:hypothetical protein
MVHVVAGRSYQAYCWAPFGDVATGFCNIGWSTPAGEVDNSSGVTSGDTESVAPGQDNRSFVPVVDGIFFVRATSGPGTTLYVMIIETTQFAPWFFPSSAAGYGGFIEIRSNAQYFVHVVVTTFDSMGTPIGSPLMSIPGNGTALVQVSSLGVPDGTFGSVQIAHFELPGAVSANLTTLSVTAGIAFDVPFTPRMNAWPLCGL